MSYEQEIQRLTYIYRDLETQLKSLEEQLASLSSYSTGVNMTKSVIEQFKKSDEKEVETLMPIGSSAYVKAKIINPDNFIVAVGRDTFIEKNANDALEWMKQLNENQKNLKTLLINKIQEVSTQMNQIKPQLDRIYNQFQVNRGVPGDPS
jgi:prefoldin alpha subunit